MLKEAYKRANERMQHDGRVIRHSRLRGNPSSPRIQLQPNGAAHPALERQFRANPLRLGFAQHVHGGVEVFRGDAL